MWNWFGSVCGNIQRALSGCMEALLINEQSKFKAYQSVANELLPVWEEETKINIGRVHKKNLKKKRKYDKFKRISK